MKVLNVGPVPSELADIDILKIDPVTVYMASRNQILLALSTTAHSLLISTMAVCKYGLLEISKVAECDCYRMNSTCIKPN